MMYVLHRTGGPGLWIQEACTTKLHGRPEWWKAHSSADKELARTVPDTPAHLRRTVEKGMSNKGWEMCRAAVRTAQAACTNWSGEARRSWKRREGGRKTCEKLGNWEKNATRIHSPESVSDRDSLGVAVSWVRIPHSAVVRRFL